MREALAKNTWFWSFLGALLVWIAIAGVAGGDAAMNIGLSALSFGAFMVLVGLGQMLVVTSGPGNIDLSIPANIALVGAVSMSVMGGEDAGIVSGIIVALIVGGGVGFINYGLIRLLQIPPIIATMSSSFILQSIAIHYGQGLKITPPEMISDFATGWLLNIPQVAWLALVVTILLGLWLARSVFGRNLSATGQNMRAAWLAGINVERVRCLCYVSSGLFAAFAALLISGFSGGATLDMGNEYLLMSIAVVVIGGTNVAGGRASVPGIWGAALLLFYINTLLNVIGFGAGGRSVLSGLIIILVIVLSGSRKQYR
jgi:ribose transport system permease protein